MSGFINAELTILPMSQQFALLIAIKIRKYTRKSSGSFCRQSFLWTHVSTPCPGSHVHTRDTYTHYIFTRALCIDQSPWSVRQLTLHIASLCCPSLVCGCSVHFCTKQEASSYHSSLVLHRHFSSVWKS